MIERTTNKTISYRIKQIVVAGIVSGVIYLAWRFYQNKKILTTNLSQTGTNG